MSTEGKPAEEEAKGVAENVLKTLGVVDIVLGAMALYAVKTIAPDTVAPLKGTGLPFADNALLVCAAGITGKVINLAASAIMAFLPVAAKFDDALAQSLAKHEGNEKSPLEAEARGFAHLGRVAKGHYIRLCDEATLSYGTALILIPVSVALIGGAKRWVLGSVALVIGVLLGALGWFRQNESVEFLAAELAAGPPASQRAAAPALGGANTGQPALTAGGGASRGR